MKQSLLRLSIDSPQDVIATRKQARELSLRIGFGKQDQARIATAVSEIAQNAFAHAGGGSVEFFMQHSVPQAQLVIVIRDYGPGIANFNALIGLEQAGAKGSGVGIAGAQRLMDYCDVDTVVGQGTVITVAKRLPEGITLSQTQLNGIAKQLAFAAMSANFEEDRLLNKELLQAMAELRTRQEELIALTRELEDTNRGVVALYAEIEEKAEHLRRADAMKSRFLSNTSHELRTPLSSIRALSQLLLDRVDGALTEAQEKQVLFIYKAANDLSELVNDLLDLAKIEAGKVDVKPTPFTVQELFSTLRGMLRPLNQTGAVELIFDDQSAMTVLHTDEGKVSQILRNLISNALKFTEHGEVRVEAMVCPDNNVIRFNVSDTGLGIAASNLQLIFEEFSQIENHLQKRSKGTGLGLPLCKKLAQLLGGSITVQSTLGAGSCFSLTLPVDDAGVESAL